MEKVLQENIQGPAVCSLGREMPLVRPGGMPLHIGFIFSACTEVSWCTVCLAQSARSSIVSFFPPIIGRLLLLVVSMRSHIVRRAGVPDSLGARWARPRRRSVYIFYPRVYIPLHMPIYRLRRISYEPYSTIIEDKMTLIFLGDARGVGGGGF